MMFCISFVVVTVKARIASLDPRLEQAAMDLYANECRRSGASPCRWWRRASSPPRCWRSALSFDDFIITNFNSGTVNTFPKFVYVSVARGIPAQANVIASAMFFLALVAVLVAQLVSGRRRAR